VRLRLEGLEERCLLSADPLTAVTDVQTVARLIGANSINNTVANWQVRGADLGHMFDLDGKLYMVFGDTFAPPAPSGGGAGGSDWRSNTMAVISNWQNPQDGLYFDSMVSDQPGHAQALIQGAHDPNDGSGEVTKIPTYGIASRTGPHGDRMYLDVMSVKQWGVNDSGQQQDGAWTLNNSAIYYSDDLGQTWQESGVVWGGDSNFGQVAIVRVGNEATPASSMLYFFGIPGGRYGSVQLARVPELKILDPSAYQYYGMVNGRLTWTSDQAAAVDVVQGPVGELSVMWDPYLHRWLMTYLNMGIQSNNASDPTLQLRDSPYLWGGWSQPHTITDSQAYPGLYGAFMHPWLTQNGGKDIYFTMSEWGPYAVYLMHATLYVSHTTAIYDPLIGNWSISSNLPRNNITLRVDPQPGADGKPVLEVWEGDAPGALTYEVGSISAAEVRTIHVTLAGGSTLNVDDSADTIGRTVTLAGSSIRGLQLFGRDGGIRYDGARLASLTMVGGPGGLTMHVSGTSTPTRIVGDAAALNTMVGPNATTVWTITGADTGAIPNLRLAFSSFGNVSGGSGPDTFRFLDGASLSGKIDGGGAVNALDYSAGWSGNVVVNLQIGLATAVAGGVTNIRNLRGAARGGPGFYDILVCNGGNTITGGNGRRNLLESGTSASTLQGGNQDDILIGGTTAYDQESDAHDFIAIMNYWSNSQDSYGVRVNNLLTGAGVPPLNAQTVANNGGGNRLLGHRHTTNDHNLYYGLRLNREFTDLNAAASEQFIKV
jgi:hypothetical protein